MAYRYIDQKGRRWLLMGSLTLMLPLLLATAFSFDADHSQGPVTVFLILYTTVSLPLQHPRLQLVSRLGYT